MTYDEILSCVRDNGKKCGHRFHVTRPDGTKSAERLFISTTGALCRFIKGSRRRGYVVGPGEFTSVSPVRKKTVSDADRFAANCGRVIGMLEASGLWPDILEETRFMERAGYDALVRERQAPRAEQAEGSGSLDWQTFEALCSGRIKRMYFGKRDNGRRLEQIRDALENRRREDFRIDACRAAGLSYDTSFGYDPKQNRAWYSEEYRNCGNGHYYLALNATHAIHYEDD